MTPGLPTTQQYARAARWAAALHADEPRDAAIKYHHGCTCPRYHGERLTYAIGCPVHGRGDSC